MISHQLMICLAYLCMHNDTTLFCSFDSNCNEDVLNAELKNVYSWLCSNRLSLNVEKTKYVSFHTAQKTVIYLISKLTTLS